MRYFKLRRGLGFSLIELMVVIAIVGILAAVAVPSYRSYIVRSKISALFPLLETSKKKVEELHSLGTILGSSYSETIISSGSSNKPENVKYLVIAGYGKVRLEFDEVSLGIGRTVLEMTPKLNNDVITWNCGYHYCCSGTAEYLPPNCRKYDSADTDM